jgi:hypothetical protein
MAMALPDGDIFVAASDLVTTYGFLGAKAQVARLSAEWEESTHPDADDGLLAWERVRAAIVIMQARLM